MSSTSDVPLRLTRPERHLFLSPHYDDIPLSAGATVCLLANRGLAPQTLVVFGSEPDRNRPLSAFAAAMHERWGLTANEVVDSRQAEEAAAADILGANTRVLPFRDAIYRGDYYLSNDDLFGSPATAEASLPAAIAASLDLADIPYALKPMALDARLTEVGAATRLEPVARVTAQSTWEQKIDAILRYPSQLETVFRQYVGVGTTRDEISEALTAYAARAGDGVMAERFWRLSDGANS